MNERYAPVGKRWRCGACGKIARDRYNGPRGWDEACFLNSYLEDGPWPAEGTVDA